jgi:hypothetical protein
MGDITNVYITMVGKSEGDRPLERLKRRWRIILEWK